MNEHDAASGADAPADDGIADVVAPRVRVIYPDGGEVLQGRGRVTIEWQSEDDVGVVSHRVQLSVDGGRTYRDLCEPLPGTARSFVWTVPDQAVERARVRVVARDAAGNLGLDLSNACFQITAAPPDLEPPELRILSPQGGSVVRGGTEVELRWRSRDNVGVSAHQVFLSFDGGASFNLLARRLPGDADRLLFTAPRIATTRARVRVVAEDGSGNRGEAESATFTIQVGPEDEPPWTVL